MPIKKLEADALKAFIKQEFKKKSWYKGYGNMILPLSVFIRVLCLHRLIDTTLELQSTPGEQAVSNHIGFYKQTLRLVFTWMLY